MAITFNGSTKVISLPTGTPDISVVEIYSRWVDWVATSDNAKYLQAMRFVGGDELPGSKQLGITYFMLNGWKIRPAEESHVLNINGNIYSEDGSSPFTPVLGSYNVTIINTVSNLVDSTVQQLPEIEYASFDGCVSYDSINGYPGTEYFSKPVGTKIYPSNNLSTTLSIAQTRGLSVIRLLSDIIVPTGMDVSGYKFMSDSWKIITLEPGSITTDTEFEKLSIYGEMSGTWNILNDCWVYNVTNFLGWVRGGSIERVELAAYTDIDPFSLGSSYFDAMVPMYANIKSIIVMNSDVSVSITSCTDAIEIQSMTTGSVVNASLSGGKIIIDNTCVAGNIILSGVGEYENNSTIVVDDIGLLNEELIPDYVMRYERV